MIRKRSLKRALKPGKTVSSVAGQYGLSPSQLFAWRRKMEAGALIGGGTEERVVPESSFREDLGLLQGLEVMR